MSPDTPPPVQGRASARRTLMAHSAAGCGSGDRDLFAAWKRRRPGDPWTPVCRGDGYDAVAGRAVELTGCEPVDLLVIPRSAGDPNGHRAARREGGGAPG